MSERVASPSCHDEGSPPSLSQRELAQPLITLVGQPNSGKTSLFNALTGSHYKTSNYPGTTVDFSIGKLRRSFGLDALVLDSPGITSLNPIAPDEETAIEALFHHPKYKLPDLVVVTADVSQLSRHLYLVRQIQNAGFKVAVALTMNDLLEKRGLELSEEKLEQELGCPAVKVNGRTGRGTDRLVERIRQAVPERNGHDAKDHIQRQRPSTEEEVLALYRWVEEVEKHVVLRRAESVDIARINRDVFNTHSSRPDAFSLRLDKILLHPIWGMLAFLVSMGIIFTSIFWVAQPVMELISYGFGLLGQWVSAVLPADTWYTDLIADGLIGGVGTVLTFLPQILILFLFLGLLEDTGYLARCAMLVDKPLSKIGLNGRSFVPMLSGFACAIPAVMAARTISNRRERMLTIFVIPLMTCSARLPVYALLLAFLIPPEQPWVAGIILGGIYLISLINGSIAAGLINRFAKSRGSSSFMLELPAYRRPVFRFVAKGTYLKSLLYIKEAGPTILICSIVIWFLTFFPNFNPTIDPHRLEGLGQEQAARLVASERLNQSFASSIGHVIEPVLRPVGWDWRVGVSLISAFAAREVFVSSIALTFRAAGDDPENLQGAIVRSMRNAHMGNTDQPLFTTASSVGLIVFFMFAMQCISTLAVVRKETGSWKFPILQQVVYTGAAYLLAVLAVNGLRAMGIN